jgi:quercetin dioxygenase-like cupin family protein
MEKPITMNDERPRAIPTVQIDNDSVLVTRWEFPAGAETGWHLHKWDCVIVPLSDGSLMLETSTGWHNAELSEGISYYRSSGVEHNAINVSDTQFSFVEIEIKNK